MNDTALMVPLATLMVNFSVLVVAPVRSTDTRTGRPSSPGRQDELPAGNPSRNVFPLFGDFSLCLHLLTFLVPSNKRGRDERERKERKGKERRANKRGYIPLCLKTNALMTGITALLPLSNRIQHNQNEMRVCH